MPVRHDHSGSDGHPAPRHRTISGVLRLPDDRPAATAKRLVFRVLDVGRVDAPATVIVEEVLTDVHLDQHTPFEVQVTDEALDAAVTGSLILQVHVDVDGTGSLAPGDLLTTQSFPVLAAAPASAGSASSAASTSSSASAGEETGERPVDIDLTSI